MNLYYNKFLRHTIINNIEEAYTTAYKLYHGYRSIVRNTIPEITDLGIFDY